MKAKFAPWLSGSSLCKCSGYSSTLQQAEMSTSEKSSAIFLSQPWPYDSTNMRILTIIRRYIFLSVQVSNVTSLPFLPFSLLCWAQGITQWGHRELRAKKCGEQMKMYLRISIKTQQSMPMCDCRHIMLLSLNTEQRGLRILMIQQSK